MVLLHTGGDLEFARGTELGAYTYLKNELTVSRKTGNCVDGQYKIQF